MKIRAESLAQDLERNLKPCYLISGEEALLANEAADHIRQSARQQGFGERLLFHADSVDWDEFIGETQTMSLFAEKRIIELRIPNSKPGDKGSKALVEFCQSIPEDILLLVIAGKLDRSQQRSKWVTTLESTGGHVQVWPVDQRQMPGWLNQRLRSKSIEADRDAVAILAERVEGNLLAAQQEVEKLSLLVEGPVDAATMAELVVNSARYDVFKTVDHCLFGNTAEAVISLQGLREEGTEATLMLWALTKEVRQILQIQDACARGQGLEVAIRNSGVWQKRQPLVLKAVRRTSPPTAANLLRLCRLADRAIKSNRHGDPWLKMKSIVMGLSGKPAIDVELELTP
jgi:DNA polymerase III subunit delta